LCSYEETTNIFTHDSIPFLHYKGSTLCHVDIEVSIDETVNKIGDLKIFPNPSSDIIHITLNTNHSAVSLVSGFQQSLVIYDIFGREQDEIIISSGERVVKVNISNYPPGVYVAMIESNQGYLAIGRFIKQ
jgi:hypothetical protein